MKFIVYLENTNKPQEAHLFAADKDGKILSDKVSGACVFPLYRSTRRASKELNDFRQSIGKEWVVNIKSLSDY